MKIRTVATAAAFSVLGLALIAQHLTLESAGQATEVHLGPAGFLRGQGVELAKGDAVEVTGSLVDSDGQSFLVARELKKGERVVKLRDEQGVPVWAAGPRSR